MKKLVVFVLVSVLTLPLAACGQGGGASGASGLSTPAGAAISATDGIGEMIELSYWYSMDGAGGEIFNRHIQCFNETIGQERGIHVTGVYQDWPGTNALMAAMATDDEANMPDVIHMFSEYINLIQNWERTVWLEEYITAANSSLAKSDLIQNTVTAYSIDGRMIGAPYAVSALLLYYNKSLLATAGYGAPPATIDEMAGMLSGIKAKTDVDYGLNVRIDQFEFENFITTQGTNGTYFGNNESGHADVMTEIACQDAIVNFLAEWEKVIASGGYKPTKDSMNEEFAQAINAMCIMSSARIPAIADLVGDDFEWGVAAIPKVAADDVGGAYPSGSGLFIINRDDDVRVNAAWEFVQYLLSADAQAMWLDGCGYVPVNMHAAQTDAYQAAIDANPRLSVAFDILSSAPSTVVGSFCPGSEEVNSVIQTAMLAFASGETTRDETYNIIVDGIAAAFTDYFRAHPID